MCNRATTARPPSVQRRRPPLSGTAVTASARATVAPDPVPHYPAEEPGAADGEGSNQSVTGSVHGGWVFNATVLELRLNQLLQSTQTEN